MAATPNTKGNRDGAPVRRLVRATAWLLAAFAVPSSAEASPQREAADPRSERQAREALERATNVDLPASERIAAYQTLLAVKNSSRGDLLRQLIAGPDEEIAAMATRALMAQEGEDISVALGDRIGAWSEPHQLIVLEGLLSTRGHGELEVARRVLRHALETGEAARGTEGPNAPAEIAALLLGPSREPNDRQLLRRVVHARPHSRGAWLALSEAGAVGEPERTLARSIYQDRGLAETNRVAAAVALGTDDRAASYVTESVRAFVSEFGHRPLEALVGGIGADMAKATGYVDFRERLRLLGALRLLTASSTERLVFEHLDVQNVLVRLTLALVAIQRWPDEFLRRPRHVFSDEEYANLLAFGSLAHPELAGRFQQGIARQRLEASVLRLRQGGAIGLFGLAGSVFLGL